VSIAPVAPPLALGPAITLSTNAMAIIESRVSVDYSAGMAEALQNAALCLSLPLCLAVFYLLVKFPPASHDDPWP
jgi:hypothetical protein